MKSKSKALQRRHNGNGNGTAAQAQERLHHSVLTWVSHDLKTPLTCIIGSLETYERTKEKLSTGKKNTLIGLALKEAYRLDSYLSNILYMAQIESDAVKIKEELCVMDLLLEDCLMALGYRLSGCDVSVKAIPVTFPVTTDCKLLTRAMSILLYNAARYGGLHPVIGVEYELVDDQVVIRVRDNGPGIPKAKLESIFSKHTRSVTPNARQHGTGLGLPICREIMRLLSGTVTVANLAKGKGAVFTLAFPA